MSSYAYFCNKYTYEEEVSCQYGCEQKRSEDRTRYPNITNQGAMQGCKHSSEYYQVLLRLYKPSRNLEVKRTFKLTGGLLFGVGRGQTLYNKIFKSTSSRVTSPPRRYVFLSSVFSDSSCNDCCI